MNFGIYALIVVLSIPLLFRWIPPNPIYGFKTPKTLANRAFWFEVNRQTAILAILFSLVAAAIEYFSGYKETFYYFLVTLALCTAALYWKLRKAAGV